jgi:hypothetical protein
MYYQVVRVNKIGDLVGKKENNSAAKPNAFDLYDKE